jgi:O-acetyl-ADP-ribose deacetylase (regulator of RNase III)
VANFRHLVRRKKRGGGVAVTLTKYFFLQYLERKKEKKIPYVRPIPSKMSKKI